VWDVWLAKGGASAMKRLALAVVVLVCALAIPGVAGATHSPGDGPKKDLVAGTARLAGFNNPLIHVNAWRDAETGRVKGHFFIQYPPPFTTALSGRVTCLNVVGTGAAVVGVVERSQGTNPLTVPTDTSVQVRVLDLGEPGTLDKANWDLPPFPFGFCNGVGDLQLSQGNYIVHADPPLAVLNVLDSLLADFEAAARDCPYG
jgi:hypothetical protein